MTTPTPEPGGFSLPSPAPTTTSTTISSSSTSLPHPRPRALPANSAKEEAVRRYVENRLLHISRRYTKKFQGEEEGVLGDVAGYGGMVEVAGDLGGILDVLWRSGTPSLQIPYMLNIAGALSTYIASFPPAPTPTFAVLRKLDHAFASLLVGRDIESGEGLPGFGMEYGGRTGMSRTDMVRCKGLVEATRVLVVQVMSGFDGVEEVEGRPDQSDMDMATDTERESLWNGGEDEDDEDVGHDMDVARVYEKTLTQLGKVLGEANVLSSAVEE